MFDLALHQNGHGLIHLVAHHGAGQRAFQACCTHCCAPFSLNTVFTRAMSRRVLPNRLVLLCCWVASCTRSPSCARLSTSSSCCSSAADFFLNSLAFMITPLSV